MIVRSDHFEFDRGKSREAERLTRDETLSEEQRALIRDNGKEQPFITDPASHCFYCGEKLTIPAIMWAGRSGDGKDQAEIWLHPTCVESLVAGLASDLRGLGLGKDSA